MGPELTPWFDGRKHKPVRPGVYMLKCGGGYDIGYQHWNGKYWSTWCTTIAGAARQEDRAAYTYQNDDWRGLCQKPR